MHGMVINVVGSVSLDALLSFESAARHLHFRKAGEDLGVTQGAISHQIISLEKTLGVKLFSRNGNRLALTPEGSRLHTSVKANFDGLVEGTRNLNPEALSGPLVIGCTQTVARSWLIELSNEFFKEYPTIEVHMQEIRPRQLAVPREIDVAICYGRPEDDDREVTFLASPAIYPVCNPRLLQSKQRRDRPADIFQFTLIHDHQVSWEQWYTRYQLDKPEKCANIYFPNTTQALVAARLGYGVALANEFEIKEFIRDGSLVRLLDKPIEEEHGYYLLSQYGENKSLKSKIFEEWVIKSIGFPGELPGTNQP